MIEATTKSYYLALLFKERPELHMTLRYWKDELPAGLVKRIKQAESSLLDSGEAGEAIEQFIARFPREDIFGFAKKVHVMRAHHNQAWPNWLTYLVAPATIKTFHVTCEDTMPLSLTACAVAIMRKKDEVCRWDLQKPSQTQPEPIQTDLFS